MCYLIYARRIAKRANNELIIQIIKEMEGYNKDGYGLLTDKTEIRTLDREDFEEKLEKNVSKSNWIMAHLRFATMGEKTLTNVHLFEQDGYRFAHNGCLSDYYSYQNKTKSDSLLYFESLMKKIRSTDDRHIAKRIRKSDFFNGGRAMLLSPTNKLFFFGNFYLYEIDGWLIVSSALLGFDKEKTKKLGDISITRANYFATEMVGVYSLDQELAEMNFVYRGEMKKREVYTKYKETTKTYNYNQDTASDEWEVDENGYWALKQQQLEDKERAEALRYERLDEQEEAKSALKWQAKLSV